MYSSECIWPSVDSDLKNIFPVSKNSNTSLSVLGADDTSTISLLNMCHAPLCTIPTFENSGVVSLLPPLCEQMMSALS